MIGGFGGPERTSDVYNLLLSNYISYARLDQMRHAILYGERENTKELNIFVDMNSFLKPILRPTILPYKTENVFTASIVNACIHYRNYFRTRCRVETTFYIVWGTNNPPARAASYNAHNRERMLTLPDKMTLIEYTRKGLDVLCKILPKIYFIDATMYETAAAMYALLTNGAANPSIPNLILSRDVYAYQLVAAYSNTFLMRPSKSTSAQDGITRDESWLVTKTNLYKAFRHHMKYVRAVNEPSSSALLPFVLAIAGLKDRHVPGLTTFNKAGEFISIMEKENPEYLKGGIELLDCTLSYNPPSYIKWKQERLQPGSVLYTHSQLGISPAMAEFATSPTYAEAIKGIVDLYDPSSLRELNDTEFEHYPIEIMEL